MFLFFYPSLKKQFIPKKKDQTKTIIYLNDKDLDTNKENEKINNYSIYSHLNFKKNLDKNDNLIIKNNFKEFKKLKNNKFKTIFFTYLYTFNRLNNIRVNGNLYSNYSNDPKQDSFSSALTMKNSSESYTLILLYSFTKYSMFTNCLHRSQKLQGCCWMSHTYDFDSEHLTTHVENVYKTVYEIPAKYESNSNLIKLNPFARHIFNFKKPFQFTYQNFNDLNIYSFFIDEFFFKIKLFNKKIPRKNDRFLKLNFKKKLHPLKYLKLITQMNGNCLPYRQREQFRQLYNYLKTEIKKNTAIIRKIEIIKNLNNLNIFNLMLNIIKNILKKNLSSFILGSSTCITSSDCVSPKRDNATAWSLLTTQAATIISNRNNSYRVKENLDNKIIIKIFDKVLNTLAIKTYTKKLFEIKNLFLIKNLIKKSSNQTVSVLIQLINTYNRFFKVFKQNFNNTKHFALNNYFNIYTYEFFNLNKSESNMWKNSTAWSLLLRNMEADIIFSSKKFDTLIRFNSNRIIKWLNILKPRLKKINYFLKSSIKFFIKVKKKLNKRDNKNILFNLSFYFNKQLWQLKKKKHNNKSLLWIYSKYWFEINYKLLFFNFAKLKKRLPFTKNLVFSNFKENKKRFFFKNLLLKDGEKKQPQLIKTKTNVCLN